MPLFKRMFKYLLPYKGRLIAGITSMLFHSFFTIFFIRVFQDLIETIIQSINSGQEGLQSLNWIALSMIIVYFLKGIAYYGQEY